MPSRFTPADVACAVTLTKTFAGDGAGTWESNDPVGASGFPVVYVRNPTIYSTGFAVTSAVAGAAGSVNSQGRTEYSTDGGSTWATLGSGSGDNQVSVSVATLSGSNSETESSNTQSRALSGLYLLSLITIRVYARVVITDTGDEGTGACTVTNWYVDAYPVASMGVIGEY